MAKKTAKKSKARTIRVETFIVKSKVKEFVAKGKFQSASNVADTLNFLVQWHLLEAMKRSQANGRKTVRGHDILVL